MSVYRHIKLQAIILFWILINDLVKFKDHFSNKDENRSKAMKLGITSIRKQSAFSNYAL